MYGYSSATTDDVSQTRGGYEQSVKLDGDLDKGKAAGTSMREFLERMDIERKSPYVRRERKNRSRIYR